MLSPATDTYTNMNRENNKAEKYEDVAIREMLLLFHVENHFYEFSQFIHETNLRTKVFNANSKAVTTLH